MAVANETTLLSAFILIKGSELVAFVAVGGNHARRNCGICQPGLARIVNPRSVVNLWETAEFAGFLINISTTNLPGTGPLSSFLL